MPPDQSATFQNWKNWPHKADSHANQIRAIELLGKSIGLWVERVETSDKTERTSDEIRASLADKLKRLSI
jgi:hypothetical protein